FPIDELSDEPLGRRTILGWSHEALSLRLQRGRRSACLGRPGSRLSNLLRMERKLDRSLAPSCPNLKDFQQIIPQEFASVYEPVARGVEVAEFFEAMPLVSRHGFADGDAAVSSIAMRIRCHLSLADFIRLDEFRLFGRQFQFIVE